MTPRVVGVIPARWASTRLPGKMLADIAGKPLVIRTLEAVRKTKTLNEIYIATDHPQIFDAVREHGGVPIMTDPALPSGSDRVLAAIKDKKADVVVNIQGDEPLIPAEAIDTTVSLLLSGDDFDVTTAAAPLKPEQLDNTSVVKVVTDLQRRALYFSRSPIPHPWRCFPPASAFLRHVGLYVFRRHILEEFCSWEVADLERCESLEQLRLLVHGKRIGVALVPDFPQGVDTEDDLERVRNHLSLSS